MQTRETTKSIMTAAVLCLFFGTPLHARDCDETCFIIDDTFSQETLKRFITAYPNSPDRELAEKRLSSLDHVREGAGKATDDGFPQPKKTDTFRIPASQAPQGSMQP